MSKHLQCLNCRRIGGDKLYLPEGKRRTEPFDWGVIDPKGKPEVGNIYCYRCNSGAIASYSWFWRLIRALR